MTPEGPPRRRGRRGVGRALIVLALLGGYLGCARRGPEAGQTVSPSPVVQSVQAEGAQGTQSVRISAPQTPGESELDAEGCLRPAPPVAKAPPPPQHLSGRLGLWVAEVDPQTLRPLRAVGTNPDSLFPLASTYKQAVLWALLREFDAGRVSPTERFDVTRQNQSLGDYPYDGTNVRELSVRMIQYSDNTATDILHRRVGLGRVQALADDLGLCRTRLILPTRDWWVAQTGLSATFNGTSRWASARGEDRLRLATLIDQDAQAYRSDYLQRRLNEYLETNYDPALDVQVHNVSTPYELGTLLAHQHLRPGLSGRALAWQQDVLARGYGRSALKAAQRGEVAWFGGKGGNGWRILTYSGYLRTKGGRHLVYAFMQHSADQTYTMPNTRRAFAWINAGVEAVLADGAPTTVALKRVGP